MLSCDDQLVGGVEQCGCVPKLTQNVNVIMHHYAGMLRGRGALLPGMVVIQTSLADVYSRLWHLGESGWIQGLEAETIGNDSLNIFKYAKSNYIHIYKLYIYIILYICMYIYIFVHTSCSSLMELAPT